MSETTTGHLLLIDDDFALATMLAEYLGPEGWAIDHYALASTGLEAARKAHHDIIVLDVMLPGMSGFEVLKQLRRHGVATPVLMLTARGDDVDRIVGLELGADDYLAKPFNPRELAARLRAVLRRGKGTRDGDLVVGPWRLDSGRHEILENERPLQLTGAEYRLLETLLRHHGQVVSRALLTEVALGRKLLPMDRSLDTHMSNLRKKLAPTDGESPIRSIRGEGYLLVPEAPP